MAVDLKKGWFCCTKLKVLAKYHEGMDLEDGRVSVYAPDDTFWKRQINLQYFEFDYCPYCGTGLHTNLEKFR